MQTKNKFKTNTYCYMMRKLLYSFLLFIFLHVAGFGQCTAYPTSFTPSQIGSDYILCFADNPATYNQTITARQYAVINVVRGYSYSFRVNNIWNATQSLSIFDDAAGNTYLGGASSNSAATTVNFIPNFSGKIRVLLLRGTGCSNTTSTTTGTLTITQTTLGNSQETQNEYGTNTWVGHIYNAGGQTPSPFSTANYAGYYNVPSESINENFGGSLACFAVNSNGAQRAQIYTEGFAVRYKMKTTKSGCYMITMSGDDGIRLFLNGINVFDRWVEQGSTTYSNIIVNLDGDDDFDFEYYENGDANSVTFTMVPFDPNANTITAPATVNFCVSGDPAVIGGSLQYSSGDANYQNPQLNFQWQLSTDGGPFANITGATTRTYDPPVITASTVNVVRRYKRLVSFTTAMADVNNVKSGCSYVESNIVTITASPTGVPVFPTTAISGTVTQCPSLAGQTYSATATNAVSYNWSVPAGWLITAGQGTNTITVNTGNAGQNGSISVIATNGCGNSAVKTLAVTTAASPTISGQPSTTGQSVCINTSATALSVTAAAGSGTISNYRWYSNNSNSNVGGALIPSATANTYTPSTVTAGTVYYYVIVTNSNGCTITSNVSGAITVNPVHTITAGASQSVCQNSTMTNITMTLGGGATGANVTGLPAGVTSSVSGNTLTISGTPTVSGVFPYNITTTGNSCTAATTSGTITVGIGNNVINFTNGTSGTVCVTTPENGTSSFTAPTGTYFNTVSFSSYGSPTGSCGNFAINYTCHSATKSQSFVEGQLLGNTGTITFFANNENFDDPCVGTIKNYYGSAAYSAPVCSGTVPGTITGTTPTGSGTYTYLWQISTTSATAGFTAAPGTNNLQNYTPVNSVTVNTWFRRVVTSGGTCPNTSAAVLIKVNPLPTIASAPTASTICFGATSASLVYTGTTGVPTTYSITWNSTPLNSFSPVTDASLTATPISIVIPSTATDGTYTGTITVKNANGCVSIGNTFSLVIRPQFTAGAINTTGETICSGGTPSQIGSTTAASGGDNVITYKWQANGVDIASSNSATYTPPIGLTATTVYRRFASDGTCNITPTLSTGTWTVTVNPLPTTPTLTKNSDFTCTSSGSVTLTNLPSGTWTIKQTGTASQTITDTGSSRNITGLVAGNYDFTVTNASSCTSSPVVSVNIVNQTSTTTWNGSGWSNGNPDGTKTIIIASTASQPFTISTPNVSGCSLIVNSGAVVTIPSGVTLTITNSVTTNGQLIFENNSSLVQTTNAVNTGDIVYKRETSVSRYDLTYWSTPVTKSGFTLYNLSPDTLGDKFSYYDSDAAAWMINYNGTMVMEIGKSYNVRAPQYFDTNTPSVFTAVFTGVPNNGNIPVNTVSEKWNLIGNPFPSAIDAKKLMADNPNLGALYFWGHNALPTQAVPGDNNFYYSNDFTTYNGTGTAGGNGLPFDGYIAATQGFFAKPSTGTIIFNNDIRRPGSNAQFYKTAESSIEKNRLWLNMTHADGVLKQALVGYVQGATNTIDLNYDAVTIGANSYIDFYSISESKKLTIQGRALPFDSSDLVPLGYKALIGGDFTISIDHGDGFFYTQAVYLEDKTTGKITDLRKENYTFSTAIGTFTDRFVLRYTSKTLGTDNFEDLENSVLVSVKNKVVKISSSKEQINEVTIYNILGQEIFNKKKINSTEFQISNLQTGNQVLLVKTSLQNGFISTKKIITN